MPTPTPTSEAPVGASILSDQIASAETSWWALSVSAGLVPGVIESTELSVVPDAPTLLTTAEVAVRLDAVPTLSGFVVVQAGAGDINNGTDATVAISNIQALWQAVQARGGVPVVALAPPSDVYGAEVIELNGLLQTSAAANGFGVLDLYTPVAAPDGSWADAYSIDGVSADAAGAQLLAQTAITQLPQLVTPK